jgi:hypothetical protein
VNQSPRQALPHIHAIIIIHEGLLHGAQGRGQFNAIFKRITNIIIIITQTNSRPFHRVPQSTAQQCVGKVK